MRYWLLLFLLFFAIPKVVLAQDDSDYMDDSDDEGYDEPYVEPPINPAQPARPGFENERDIRPVPPSSRDRGFGAKPPGAPVPSGGIASGGASGDAIEFKLVDPPKYWKPRKRKFHYPKEMGAESKTE